MVSLPIQSPPYLAQVLGSGETCHSSWDSGIHSTPRQGAQGGVRSCSERTEDSMASQRACSAPLLHQVWAGQAWAPGQWLRALAGRGWLLSWAWPRAPGRRPGHEAGQRLG